MSKHRTHRSFLLSMLGFAAPYAWLVEPLAAQVEYDWQYVLPETNGTVFCMTVWDDGSGPALYLGGDFSLELPANQILRWDGTNLTPLPGEIDHISLGYTIVYTMAVFEGDLIIGGDFTRAGGVPVSNMARWNGSVWAPLGAGSQDAILALFVYYGTLLADRDGLSRWNGTDWEHFGPYSPSAFTVYNGDLVVGGSFPGGIARWNGSSWSLWPIQPNNTVNTLTVYNGQLIAGGSFTALGGTTASRIARWNGTSWSSLGSGVNDIVLDLELYNGQLIAGGAFVTAGGIQASQVAAWNGATWSRLDEGVVHRRIDHQVQALQVSSGKLIAGGYFWAAQGAPPRYWAIWGPTQPESDCDDGLFCNGAETCDELGGTVSGPPPCAAGQFCRESDDQCVACLQSTHCADGLYCNGDEVCSAGGQCLAGSIPCPGDICLESSDSCVECLSDSDCSDGLFCNGAEACDASNQCQAGAAPCTGGLFCREGDDLCVECLQAGDCSDGLYCNGPETCSASGDCAAGAPPCPAASCDEAGDVCQSTERLWMCFASATAIPDGVGTVQNEDIVAWDPVTGTWSLVFDGSDVGLSAATIGGLARLPNGDILLTFTAPTTIPGLIGGPGGTSVDDSDVVRFMPASLGAATSGTFSFYFDGSDVGLTTSGEIIDAVALAPDGRLVFSTTDAFSALGASGEDEDLFIFTAASLGSITSGSFAIYVDGSDVALTTTNEDVDAASITNTGMVLLSTSGSFTVSGLIGADEDVFKFTPSSLGSSTAGSFAAYFDASLEGISTATNVTAVEWIQ